VTKSTFDKIKAGLDDAKAYLEGSADKSGYRIHVPDRVSVKKMTRPSG
jgi:putative transcriptional regulator